MIDLSLLVQQLQLWSEEHLFVGDQTAERGNVQLDCIGKRSHTSTFAHRCQLITLPDHYSYRVYYFPKSLVRGDISDDQGWLNGADLLNDQQMRFWVYDNFGKVLPLSTIFVRGFGNSVFLIVRSRVMSQILTEGAYCDNLFITYWRNPHPERPISVKSYVPVYDKNSQSYSTDITSLSNDLSNIERAGAYGSLYVNGYDVSFTYNSFSGQDYIELVTETDVLAEFDVTIDDNITGYQSDLYKDYREILHMPKSLNPNKLIILHDSIDVVIRDNQSRQGLYLGRYDERSVRQITHQDYSVSRTDVDALRDSLHAATIIATVRVRYPYRQKKLEKDVNYIKDLYRCDDKTILRHLRGEIDSRFTYWTAQTLESSGWLSYTFSNGDHGLTFDGTRVSYPSLKDTLNRYTQSLGYYNTASILSQSLKQGYWDEDQMIIYIPPALYDYDLFSYVFIDGYKLSNKLYTVKRVSKDKSEISLLYGPYPDTSKINIVTRDASGKGPIPLTITQDKSTYTTSTKDFLLYSSDDGINFSVLNRSANSWMLSDNGDGTWTILFKPDSFNKTIFFVPRNVAQKNVISLDDDLSRTNALIYYLKDEKNYPVFHANHIDVFLNGKWLINGVDFILIDDPQGKRLFITNKCFLDLKDSGNYIEWFTTADYVVCDDVDYVVNNEVMLKKFPFVVESGMTNLFVEGQLFFDYKDEGGYLQTDNVTDCAAAEAILSIPYVVNQLLSLADQETDTNRRILINTYFQDQINDQRPKVITKQHSIYSIYLQQIINDLCRGVIHAVNDNDNENFIRQFPDTYNLRQNDPALVKENLVDRDYVAVSATYNDKLPLTDQATSAIIQRLINLLLVRPFFTVGENYL